MAASWSTAPSSGSPPVGAPERSVTPSSRFTVCPPAESVWAEVRRSSSLDCPSLVTPSQASWGTARAVTRGPVPQAFTWNHWRAARRLSAGSRPHMELPKDEGEALNQVLELAQAGDPLCREVVHDAGILVGRACHTIAAALNPQAILVGGRVLQAGAPSSPSSENRFMAGAREAFLNAGFELRPRDTASPERDPSGEAFATEFIRQARLSRERSLFTNVGFAESLDIQRKLVVLRRAPDGAAPHASGESARGAAQLSPVGQLEPTKRIRSPSYFPGQLLPAAGVGRRMRPVGKSP